jgi:hypothetical protein
MGSAATARAAVEAHEPLIPEGARLLEEWDLERAARLIRKLQGDDRGDALGAIASSV